MRMGMYQGGSFLVLHWTLQEWEDIRRWFDTLKA
jgi:hypothetical protein